MDEAAFRRLPQAGQAQAVAEALERARTRLPHLTDAADPTAAEACLAPALLLLERYAPAEASALRASLAALHAALAALPPAGRLP